MQPNSTRYHNAREIFEVYLPEHTKEDITEDTDQSEEHIEKLSEALLSSLRKELAKLALSKPRA